ncbi:MAG: extracellular solute-binding protein [Anaerolineae bacterium]|nr:MAG: extracellular solute-binding protein [Anaerolineae bacterium]
MHLALWHALPPAWLRGPLAQFNRANPWGIRVEARAFPDEAALQAALPQAEAGTLILGYPMLYTGWPQDFTDMQPWVESASYGFSAAEQGDFIPVFWQEGVVNGQRYAVPLLRNAAFLVRNHSWAAELGFAPIPGDVAAFQQQSCAANTALKHDADVYNDGLGGWVVNTRPEVMLGWLYAFQAPISETGSHYTFDTPEAESTFTFLKALYDQDCAWVGTEPYPDAYLGARQALFAAATLSDLPFIAQAFDEAGNPDTWGALPFPSPDGESPVLPTFGPSFAVIQTTEPQQALAAWLFMRAMLATEVQTQLVQQSGYLPVRQSALQAYGAPRPAWQAVADALPYARPEPAFPSWNVVQWVLQDAGAQLFQPYFTPERIPDTLELLDETANELISP